MKGIIHGIILLVIFCIWNTSSAFARRCTGSAYCGVSKKCNHGSSADKEFSVLELSAPLLSSCQSVVTKVNNSSDYSVHEATNMHYHKSIISIGTGWILLILGIVILLLIGLYRMK